MTVQGLYELADSLDDPVKQGKVFYLGVSDTPAWIVTQFNQYAKDRGLRPFSCINAAGAPLTATLNGRSSRWPALSALLLPHGGPSVAAASRSRRPLKNRKELGRKLSCLVPLATQQIDGSRKSWIELPK